MDEAKRPLKVFLCHARADKQKVRDLYRYLLRRRIKPWFDEIDLVGGQDWQVEIPKALSTSDAIIICLTKNSVDKEGYIQKEIKFALDKALEMPEGRIFLIPVRFEECDVPFSLSRYQWVDLFDETGYVRMMRALKFRASQLERVPVEVPKVGGAIPKIEPPVGEGKPVAATETPALVKPEEMQAEHPKPGVERSEPKKAISPRKPNPAIIVALIVLIGTIFATQFASPLIADLFAPEPSMTVNPTLNSMVQQTILALTAPVSNSETQTATPTLGSVPKLTVSISSNCRNGPGTQYERLGALLTDMEAEIVGKYSPGNYWVIKNPSGDGICWLWGGYANVSGDVSGLPEYPAPATPTPSGLPIEITDSQGVDMVLVPAGEFTMGSSSGDPDESPEHRVTLDAFYIDKYEVTHTLYRICMEAGVCDKPKGFVVVYNDPQYAEHPVVYVNWTQANTYCDWRGARLPTEAEWEKAARGDDGRTYPWGEGLSCEMANYEGCISSTVEVGSYPEGKSPYGAYDMAGNVLEWVADWYSATYYQASDQTNPAGPGTGEQGVIRGGGWLDNIPGFYEGDARSSDRTGYNKGNYGSYLGFRCAMDANP